jgi:probable rRNA maturation factor
MILRLVDRCPVVDFPGFGPEQLSLYERLVSGLGRPEWSFDLVLVDDSSMAGLNEQFRGKSGVTDVLSFSNLVEEGGGKSDLSRGQGSAFTDLWKEEFSQSESGENDFSVGEVILAPGFVAERCQKNQWSLEEEYALLVLHGCLHLLGWDHRDQVETEAMQIVEEKLLAACGLPHPLRNEEQTNG